MRHEACKKTPDLDKQNAVEKEDLETLITKSIENCSLNAAEGREILKRLKQEKESITKNTKDKLLTIAIQGGWNQIAYKLDPQYRKKIAPAPQLSQKPSGSHNGALAAPEVKETQETLDAKSNLEFLTKMIEAQRDEIDNSKQWDSLSFWQGANKKAKRQILDQLILVFGYLAQRPTLSSRDIQAAVESELSTTEGGKVFNTLRQEIKKFVLSFFVQGEFMKNFKEISLKKIRENLGSAQFHALFKKEFGVEYTPGMKVPEEKKWLLRAYENAFDTKNEWTTLSDESAEKAKSLVAYDLTTMLASGLGTGAIIKGGTALAMKSVRVASAVDKVEKAGTAGKVLTTTGNVVAEGTTFTALHEGIRNQEWFLNQNDVTKKIIMNSLMFGTFKFASQVPTQFLSGIKAKNPALGAALDGLLKQGLIAPAFYTAGMMGYENMTQAQQKSYQDWLKEFIMVGLAGGAFHLSGQGAKKLIEGLGTKAQLNPNTKEITVETPRGKEIIVPLTEAESGKITPPPKEKVPTKEFQLSAPQLKNLEDFGIVLNNKKFEFIGLGDIFGHFLGGKTLADFVSIHTRATKDFLHLQFIDKKGVITLVQVVKTDGQVTRIMLADSKGMSHDFQVSKGNGIIDSIHEKDTLDGEVEVPVLTTSRKAPVEAPVSIKEQYLISRGRIAQMKEFGILIEGENFYISHSKILESMYLGKPLNISEYLKIQIVSQTPTEMKIELIHGTRKTKETLTLHKNGDTVTRVDLVNFGPGHTTRSFDTQTPVLSSGTTGPSSSQTDLKLNSSHLPSAAPAPVAPAPTPSGASKSGDAPKTEKSLEVIPPDENFLVKFFKEAKPPEKNSTENNTMKLIIRDGANGNVRVDFGFKGEIKGGAVLMNRKLHVFTVKEGKFTFNPDDKKITKDDILAIIKKYKPEYNPS